MSGSNHATRLKAKAFRREFATLSQSSPLCLARFARSSQDIRMSERNKGAKQKPEAIGAYIKGQFSRIRHISKEVCRILRLCLQMQCLSGKLTMRLRNEKADTELNPYRLFSVNKSILQENNIFFCSFVFFGFCGVVSGCRN